MRYLNLITLLTLFFMNSCGTPIEDTDSTNTANLVGSWVSDCTQDKNNSEEASIYTWDFNSISSFSNSQIRYSSSDCSSESAQWIIQGSGTFSINSNNEPDPKAVNLPSKIAFTYTTVSITPKSVDTVKFLKDNNYCNSTSWKLDNLFILLGKTCSDNNGEENIYPKNGEAFFDLVDATKNFLWLGNKENHYTERTEPKEISSDLVFNKTSN